MIPPKQIKMLRKQQNDLSAASVATALGKIEKEEVQTDIFLKILVKTNHWKQMICHKICANEVANTTFQMLKVQVFERVFGAVPDAATEMSLWNELDARMIDEGLVHLFVKEGPGDIHWELCVNTDKTMNYVSEDDFGTKMVGCHEQGIYPHSGENSSILISKIEELDT